MKKIFVGLIIFLMILSVIAAAGRIVTAQDAASSVEILKKLDDMIAAQKAIAQDIAMMKEEIKIIKIRVTQNQ
jgi:hypothetical protein